MSPVAVSLYCGFALLAFAGNSVLCRMALQTVAGSTSIDPSSFTLLRLLSGAVVLGLLLKLPSFRPPSHIQTQQDSRPWSKKGLSGLALGAYAATFSWAYTQLDTGTGALILFAVVQLFLTVMTLVKGQRINLATLVGIITAFAGFTYLVWPNLSTPSATGMLLMSLSGIAWGAYTYLGMGSKQPIAETSSNFLFSVPLTAAPLLLILAVSETGHISTQGALLALLSGGITSGLGYALWYKVLPALNAMSAGVLQLSVPLIAAFGGIVLLGEAVTLRFFIAAALILGGIFIVLKAKNKV